MSEPAWFVTVNHDTVYEGVLSTVHIDEIRMPDGSVAKREYVEHDDAVAIVPVTDDGAVLLLKQYRHPFGRYFLEVPAGKMDVAGEDPAETAVRELVEEIGYTSDELTLLTSFENSAGWTTERTHVYLARQLREASAGDFQAEAEEADMEVVTFTLADAVGMARRGELTDAKTALGLLLAGARLGL